MIIDGRTLSAGERLDTDLAIIGAGAAGITLARELKDAPFRVALIESGGLELEDATQDLYGGESGPQPYAPLDSVRLRYFGGSTNHWSGWCRPLDSLDFEAREDLGLPGWPITRGILDPYYRRAQSVLELGRFAYDDPASWIAGEKGGALPLGQPGVETRIIQFSPPTRFGERYREEIAQAQNLRCLLHLNAADFIARDRRLEAITLKRLDGAEFELRAKIFVLACGGIENARLLLNADAERAGGIANSSGLVGRNFMDHPLIANVATLVAFRPDGLGAFHLEIQNGPGGRYRAGLMAGEALRRSQDLLSSLTTIDHITAVWDADGKRNSFSSARQSDPSSEAAVRLAVALAGGGLAPAEYALGAGLEVAPDEQSRIALLPARDALGLRRVRVDWRLSEAARESYLKTLDFLGAQLQASGAGLLRVDEKFVEEWPENADWASHHMGTTRMSVDPRTGVVDPDLRTHDLDNFYIAGSSVFPSYGAAPPTLTIVALALRLADRLKDRFRA